MHAAAIGLAIVFGALSGLHGYWAAGGLWGIQAVLPADAGAATPQFTPGPALTLVVAVLLLAAAGTALVAAGLLRLPVPAWMPTLAIWTLALVLLVRGIGNFSTVGLFKRVRGTRFGRMDTLLYTPLCLTLSALAWIVVVLR